MHADALRPVGAHAACLGSEDTGGAMSIYDKPSPWTTDQIFNRLCKAVERPHLWKKESRPSLSAQQLNSTVGKRLVEAISEHNEMTDKHNHSASELAAVIRGILNDSQVFHFEIPVIKRIGEYCSQNPQDLIAEPFPRFPFSVTTLVNPYNAIMLFDADDGTNDRHAWPEEARWRCKFAAYYQEETAWFYVVGCGLLLDQDPVTMARCIRIQEASMSCAYAENGDSEWGGNMKSFAEDRPEQHLNLMEIVRQSLSMAFDACRYIEQPRHHLVIEEPKSWKPGQERPKIARSTERPRVRIVEPEEVRRIYPHQTNSTGRTVTPHARRGHIKTLRHPRYKEAQGRRLIIQPTWVGDPEWEHAGTKYKVVYRPDRIAK